MRTIRSVGVTSLALLLGVSFTVAGCRHDPEERRELGVPEARQNVEPGAAQGMAGTQHTVSLVGCIQHEPRSESYWLTDVAREGGGAASGMGPDPAIAATSDAAGMTVDARARYRLVPQDEQMKLQAHLGERVRVTGKFAEATPAASTGEPVRDDDPGAMGGRGGAAERGRDATTGRADVTHGAPVGRALRVTHVEKSPGNCNPTR